MEGRANYLRVGLLLVGGAALMVALLWFLHGGQVTGGTVIVTYFPESVQGLQPGSQVQYLGVTVGRVTQIGVVSAKYGTEEEDVRNPLYRQVYVLYTVDASKFGRNIPSPEQAVQMGLRARLQSQFITNLSYIDLDFVDPKQYPVQPLPWKPEAVYVPSVPSAFAQVRNAGQQLLSELDQVDVSKFVTTITTLAENLNQELTSGDLHKTLASAQSLLTSSDLTVKQAGLTLQQANLPKLTADLQKTSEALRSVATGPDTRKILSNGAQATERLDALLARLSVTVNQLQTSLTPFLGNMETASANLRELSASLRAYPGQVLSGPPPPVRGPLH